MGCREKETSREEGQKVPGCQKIGLPRERYVNGKRFFTRHRSFLIQRWPQNSVIVRREECLRFRASLSTGSRKDCQDSNMSRTNQIKRKRHQKRMSRERNVKEKSSKSRRNGCDNQAMKFRLGSPIFPPFGPTSITRLGPGLYWYLYSKYPVLKC